MANPVIVACPKDVWTVVAVNQTAGIIHILKTDPDVYYQTYRLTGGGAPTTFPEAVPFVESLQISASAAIDVYISTKGEDGSVRVDL